MASAPGLAILESIGSPLLYDELIRQMNKDFTRAGLEFKLTADLEPRELVGLLRHEVFRIIQFQFNDFLNLLYAVDVPEKEVKKIAGLNAGEYADKITYLILWRSWQKVSHRQKYSDN